jgi:hypothetical protein
MNKHIAVIFVILISLTSTTLFAQSSGINDNINNDIIELSTKMSVNPVKSSPTFSIGAGYAGYASENGRPNGFNIQADVLYPVSKSFGINIALNYVQFQGYKHTNYLKTTDSTYANSYSNPVTHNHINLLAGISYGNTDKNCLLNYYVTAGIGLGLSSQGQIYFKEFRGINNGTYEYSTETLPAESLFMAGVYASGRISFKLSHLLRFYAEPSIYTWTISGESNYHINGGVSLAL